MTHLLTAIDLHQHKLGVDADSTRLAIWHFSVTLDLPLEIKKLAPVFGESRSELRWNWARIIHFPRVVADYRDRKREEESTSKECFFFVSTSGKTPKCGDPELKFLTSGTDYLFVCSHCGSGNEPALLGDILEAVNIIFHLPRPLKCPVISSKTNIKATERNKNKGMSFGNTQAFLFESEANKPFNWNVLSIWNEY